MRIAKRTQDRIRRLHCARERRRLIGELEALDDWQRADVGTWRGAVPDFTAEVRAGQGRPRRPANDQNS